MRRGASGRCRAGVSPRIAYGGYPGLRHATLPRRLPPACAYLRAAPWLMLDEPAERLGTPTKVVAIARLASRLAPHGPGAIIVSHCRRPLSACVASYARQRPFDEATAVPATVPGSCSTVWRGSLRPSRPRLISVVGLNLALPSLKLPQGHRSASLAFHSKTLLAPIASFSPYSAFAPTRRRSVH